MSLFSTWMGGDRSGLARGKTCCERYMSGFGHECFANVVKDPFKIVSCSEKFLFLLPCLRVAFQSSLLAGFALFLLRTQPQVFTVWMDTLVM